MWSRLHVTQHDNRLCVWACLCVCVCVKHAMTTVSLHTTAERMDYSPLRLKTPTHTRTFHMLLPASGIHTCICLEYVLYTNCTVGVFSKEVEFRPGTWSHSPVEKSECKRCSMSCRTGLVFMLLFDAVISYLAEILQWPHGEVVVEHSFHSKVGSASCPRRLGGWLWTIIQRPAPYPLGHWCCHSYWCTLKWSSECCFLIWNICCWLNKATCIWTCLCNKDLPLTRAQLEKLKSVLINRKPCNLKSSLHSLLSPVKSSIHLHFISAKGRLQCDLGLCVLFKGITGENFRSNTTILQLPAHSQKTPLLVAGIDPRTFRLLFSLYIQANLGRGGGCLWDVSQMYVCVWLSGWGCCIPSVRSTLHLPRPLSDRPTYITTPNTSVSLSSPSSSSLFPLSLPPSIHLSSHPPSHLLPSLMSAGVSQLPTSLSLSLFHLLAAPPPTRTHLSPGLPEYHLHRWCLIITPALLYLSPSSSAIGPIPAPWALFL